MAITAQMVKELREKTGAGMMDCKKALQETDGAIDAAIKFLREKGLAAAAKKAGRVAAEGLVAAQVEGSVAAVLELNCETDFVAKNDEFQKLLADLTNHVLKENPADVDAMLGQTLHGASGTVKDVLTEKISTIGENLSLRRFQRMDAGNAYGAYLHGGGKIGVIVELSVADADKATSETITTAARDLAMHVASEAPLGVSRDDIDDATIEAEKEIFKKQALDQGKPEAIVEKIVMGRVNKFLAESCLLDQPFVKDPDVKVSKLLSNIGGELGTEVKLNRFVRFQVGEGIEKKSDNLAEEVAKMTGG